jgi:hypothetical protein
MKKLKEKVLARLLSIDPKLVATATTFVLTYVATGLLHLGTDKVIVTVGSLKITVATAIAFAAGHAAGYVKENAGTLLRRGALDDGNPTIPPGVELKEAPDGR